MRKSLCLSLLQGALFLAAVAPAGATTIITDFYLDAPIFNTTGADHIAFHWSTPLTTGPVSAADLTALAMNFYHGSALVYTDVAIAGGVVQPLGGITRSPSDIFFDYDLNTMTLHQFGNLQTTDPTGATGTHYYLTDSISFPADAVIGIQAIVNGARQSFTDDKLAHQASTTVPEPATNTIVGLSLAALAWYRRRRA